MRVRLEGSSGSRNRGSAASTDAGKAKGSAVFERERVSDGAGVLMGLRVGGGKSRFWGGGKGGRGKGAEEQGRAVLGAAV